MSHTLSYLALDDIVDILDNLLGQPNPLAPEAHGAAADEHHLLAPVAEARDLLTQSAQARQSLHRGARRCTSDTAPHHAAPWAPRAWHRVMSSGKHARSVARGALLPSGCTAVQASCVGAQAQSL